MDYKQKFKYDVALLNNYYRQNKKSMSGKAVLLLMWDVGDLITKCCKKLNVKPHGLFWDIYGNSEGAKNQKAKSNLTREFMQRSERIRRFHKKNEIIKIFPNLNRYTLYREAMSFFTDKAHLLTKAEKQDLINLLNSNEDYVDIKSQIISLKSQKSIKGNVGRPNPRNQRLGDVEPQKKIFYKFYQYIESLNNKDEEDLTKELAESGVNCDFINSLAVNTNALMQEKNDNHYFEIPPSLSNNLWKEYALMLQFFMNDKTPQNRKRFRRLVEMIEMYRLAQKLFNIINEVNKLNKKAN